MQLLRLKISSKIRKFFKLLRRRLFLILLLTLPFLLINSSFAFIGTGVHELLKQNANTLLILALELVTESGPDFKEQSKEYAWMIHQFVDHMENERFSPVIRILFTRFSLEERLAPVVEALEMARDEGEAMRAIIESGQEIVRFYTDTEKFAPGPVVWPKYKKLPERLLIKFDEALKKSHQMIDAFKNQPTLKNAYSLCEANRRAILLIFLTRLWDHDKERIKVFRNDVQRALDYYNTLVGTMKDSKDKKRLLEWAKSEQYRLAILDAMLVNDMDKACLLMREAIDKAFKEKHGMRLDE